MCLTRPGRCSVQSIIKSYNGNLWKSSPLFVSVQQIVTRVDRSTVTWRPAPAFLHVLLLDALRLFLRQPDPLHPGLHLQVSQLILQLFGLLISSRMSTEDRGHFGPLSDMVFCFLFCLLLRSSLPQSSSEIALHHGDLGKSSPSLCDSAHRIFTCIL